MTVEGIDPNSQWKPVSYIPYEMMHRKWQYHLLNMLRKNVSDPAVEKDIDRAWNDYAKGFVAYLQPGEVPPGGQGLAHYLAKYVVAPPISVRRIEAYDGKTVRYQLSRQNAIAAAQSHLDSYTALGHGLDEETIHRLWPGIDLDEQLQPGQGDWAGFTLIKISSRTKGSNKHHPIELSRYVPTLQEQH